MQINKINLYCFFLIMPYLKPFNVTLIPVLDEAFKIWKIIATFLILLSFLKRIKRIRLSKAKIYLIIFCIIYVGSLYANTGTFGDSLQNILSILGMTIWYQIAEEKKYAVGTLSAVSFLAKTYMVLNLVTVLIQKPILAPIPETNYLRYFLGGDNYFAFILIPLCGIMFGYDIYKFGKIGKLTFFFSVLGWLSLAIQFSVTGMIAYALMLILLCFIQYPMIRKFFTIKRMAIICGIFLVFVLRTRIVDVLNPILSALLGEEKVGLNSRVIIWEKAVQMIIKRPILGYGTLSETQIESYWLYGASHAHNFLLEILLSTGLVGSIVFIMWIKKSVKLKASNRSVQVLNLSLSCLLFCGLFDFYILLIYFYLLVLTIELVNKNIYQ